MSSFPKPERRGMERHPDPSIDLVDVESPESGYRPMDFDRLLETAGDMGVYQITLFLLISAMEFVAVDSFSINFIAARMDHWCRLDELSNVSFVEQRRLAVPPRNEKLSSTGYSQCLRYDPIDVAMSIDGPSWNVSTESIIGDVDAMTTAMMSGRRSIECDNGWTYDRSVFASSIVSEWDLVCDQAWLIDLVSAVYMIGRLVACMCYGSIADRFGRKPTVLVFHSIKLVGSVMSIYAPYYWLFVISRFIIAVGSTASNLATFVIVSEITGKSYRSAFGIGWSLMLAVGTVTMPGIAYLVRDWRTLQSIYTWPQIALLAYIFLLDESPRWLIVKRRVKEAMVILHKVAAVNRRNLPHNVTVDVPPLTTAPRKSRFCECSVRKLVSTPNLRKWSLILWLNWFTASLMYYALSLNAGRLPGDIFVNMFLLAFVEIPANLVAVPLLERVGRRLTLSVSMLLAGISSVLMIPFMYITGADIAVTVFGVLGKALITISYSSAYIVTTETYPTDVRALGMGVSTSFARFSSLFGSFVGGIMTETWRPLPAVIFGTLGLISGALAFMLPETMNRNLPSTVEEAENFHRRAVSVEEIRVVQVQNKALLGQEDDKKEPVVSNGNGYHVAEIEANGSLLAKKTSPLFDQKL